MAYYKHTYIPGFTTNDTYGNFYDGKKASLITVPDGLKNYALDVKNTEAATSGAEYGDFMTQQQLEQLEQLEQLHRQQQQQQQQWPMKPQGSYSQEPLERFGRPPPPPPQAMPSVPPPLSDPEPLASSREPPPPVSIDRYRNPAAAGTARQLDGTAATAAAAQRLPRSRSPPPPPDLGSYRSNMEAYTGRDDRAPLVKPAKAQVKSPPPSSPEPLAAAAASRQPPVASRELLPALRFGPKEIRLPDIEAVELHMQDKSKLLLNVREFYSRYLRD